MLPSERPIVDAKHFNELHVVQALSTDMNMNKAKCISLLIFSISIHVQMLYYALSEIIPITCIFCYIHM